MWPSTSSSSSSSQFLQDFHTRRLLRHNPLYASPAKALAGATMVAAPPSSSTGSHHHPSDPYMGQSSFDSNIVMILSVLLCALICALGLNSIIRCALRCSSQQGALESGNSPSTALPARLADTGIKKKALKTFPTMTYSAGLKMPGLDSECIICLSEFAPGERLRFLPKCNHGFHVRCIDKWLMAHSSCPTCRHCLMETCQKIVGCSSQASSSEEGTLPAPLEPEGLIRDYRGIY